MQDCCWCQRSTSASASASAVGLADQPTCLSQVVGWSWHRNTYFPGSEFLHELHTQLTQHPATFSAALLFSTNEPTNQQPNQHKQRKLRQTKKTNHNKKKKKNNNNKPNQQKNDEQTKRRTTTKAEHERASNDWCSFGARVEAFGFQRVGATNADEASTEGGDECSCGV